MQESIGRSISSGYRPIGAEVERMVIIEKLHMEVVSIGIQHTLNPLYPMVKDEFQSRPLNFTQNVWVPVRRFSDPGNCCPASTAFMWPEGQKSEIRRCQVRTVRRMGYSNKSFFSRKFSEAFERWT
jgi:hypothetical protein